MSNGHGSDIQETPDWWMASDGRWYPPELHPDYTPPTPPAPAAPAAPVQQAPASTPPAAGTGTGGSLSLSERLRAAADRVGEDVSAAADSVGGGAAAAADGVADKATDLAAGARSTLDASAVRPASAGMESAADLARGASTPPAGASSDDLLDSARSTLGADAPGTDPRGTLPGDAASAGAAAAAAAMPSAAPPSTPPVTPSAPPAQPPAAAPAQPPAASAPPVAPGAAPAAAPLVPPGAPSTPPAPGGPASPPPPSGPMAAPIAPGAPTSPPAQPPAQPPAPSAAPPVAPSSAPPAPSASPAAPPPTPLGSPPAPTGPPVAPVPTGPSSQGTVVEGPGGITYTAPPEEPTHFPSSGPPPTAPGAVPGQPQTPADLATSAPAGRKSSPVAGVVALLGGAAALVGSLLQWGKGSVESSSGVEKALIEVAGFDSNGLLTAVAGAGLIVLALLFFSGIPRQLYWAVAAFIGGGVIVGAVVFSMIDIADLSDRYAAEWQTTGLAAVGDVIMTQADLGLWVAGAGGVLGVLAAPFVDRS